MVAQATAQAMRAALAVVAALVMLGGPAVASDPPRPPAMAEQAAKPKPPKPKPCWAMWLGIWQMCIPR